MSVKKIESLNKHEKPETNTNPFNIDMYLNNNWDKVKNVVDNNADELTVAQQDISNIKTKNTEQDSRVSTNENNIKSLQTDNTTNKKDISDIKSKNTAQDTNIETLTQRLNEKDNQIAELKAENEDLKADLSNSQIHGQASGEYVHLSDSAKMNCGIAVFGNSKQETRQGYNLLKNKAISQTTNGITATKNSDGSIKYSGICTQTFFMDINEISLESGTYSLYGFSNGSNNSYMLISALQGIRTLAEQKDKPTPFTLTETLKVIFRVYIFEGAEINETLYPMLINGNDLTKPYEPYGAMPSIDYPSEIEVVGDNKNSFDKDNAVSIYSNGGAKSSIIDGGIRVTSVNTNQATFCLYLLLDVTNYKNKTFTVRAKNKTSASNKARIMLGLCDENGQNRITGPYANDSEKSVSYTIPNELTTSKFLGLWLYSNADGTAQPGDYVDYTEIKLVEGTEVGSYSSYGCGSANIKVCNKNVLKLNDFTITNAGITATVKNGEINIKGTSTANSTLLIPIDLLLKNNSFCLGIKAIGTLNSNTVALRLLTENTSPMNNYSFANTYIALKQNETVQLTENITNARKFKYLLISVNNGYTVDFKAYVQVEEGTATDYITHEEQNYPVNMQEPFRAIGDVRDCFVLKEDGKWYERHKISRKIFDGSENFASGVNGKNSFYLTLKEAWKKEEIITVISSHLQGVAYSDRAIDKENIIYINCGIPTAQIYIRNTNFTTLEEFKTYLAEQYDAGTPIYVDYIAETSLDIECTEQQTQQLNALQKAKTYKNITNITTDTIAVLDVDYKKDLETYQKQQDDRITAIEQLLSTTATSAMLLDNVQTDLESEVQ